MKSRAFATTRSVDGIPEWQNYTLTSNCPTIPDIFPHRLYLLAGVSPILRKTPEQPDRLTSEWGAPVEQVYGLLRNSNSNDGNVSFRNLYQADKLSSQEYFPRRGSSFPVTNRLKNDLYFDTSSTQSMPTSTAHEYGVRAPPRHYSELC